MLNKSGLKIFMIAAFLLLLALPCPAQEAETKKTGDENIVDFMEQGMKEIDYYSLEELLNVQVEVASLFAEDELVVGSTVTSTSSRKWEELGARRMHEALNNEMGVHTTPNIAGIYNIAVRGYTNSESDLGISTLIDGIPANIVTLGMAFPGMPNIELGILEKIEMIKGPGSSIYGSDAFHGVLLLKTFESDKDHYSVGLSGAYPLYGDANLKVSRGFGDNLVRIDAAFGASYQGEQDLEYDYSDAITEGTGERDYKYNSQSGTFKVRINPSGKLQIKLNSYFTRFKSEEFPATYISSLGLNMDKDYGADFSKYYIGAGTATYTFDNNISVEASGYYESSDLEYTLSATPGGYVTQYGLNEQEGGKITVKQPDNPLNLQWLVAYSYTQSKLIENYADINTPIFEDPDYQLPSEGFERKINSAYSQLKWGAVKDKLYFLAGGRLDYYEDLGSQVTPRGGAIFLPTKKSSVKTLYGRAFKAPNQVQLYGFPFSINGNEDLEPETIDVYELTYIYKSEKWKFNITGYYSKWKNAIVAIRPAPREIPRYYNKGNNDSIGGETNIFFSFDPFAIDLGYAYVSSRAIDAQDPEDLSKTKDIKYAAFPENSVNAGMHYTLKPFDINFYLNNRIYWGWKEGTLDLDPDAEDLPPYYRADLNISKVVTDKFEVFLDIRNLFNRENHVPSVFTAEEGYVEPGISVMLRAGYKL